MLALFRDEGNRVVLRETDEPRITRPDEVLVKVRDAAVCTTDLAIVSGAFGGTVPMILGHEVAGEVVETGAGAGNVAPGDRVVLQPTISCGVCPPCREGNWHLCPNRRFVGLDADGGLAPKMVVPKNSLVKIPAAVSLRDACLAEPLACVIHAMDVIGPAANKGVIITGAGVSAFLFVQVLMRAGVPAEKILVSGRRDRRLEIIQDLGARVIDVRRQSLKETSRGIFGEAGPGVLIDQTGNASLLDEALDIVSRKGLLFIYDFLGTGIPFHFGKMQLREIEIKTSTGCPGTLEAALADMACGRVKLSPAITHVFGPEKMDEAFAILKTKDPRHVKSVVEFPQGAA